MPPTTRTNRKRHTNATRKSKSKSKNRFYSYFQFLPNTPTNLLILLEVKTQNKVMRGAVIFQNGIDYAGNKNMTIKDFNAAVKEQETLRKHGLPGGKKMGVVYRTSDKTPAEFAAIAAPYHGRKKETPQWFQKQLDFLQDQITKLNNYS